MACNGARALFDVQLLGESALVFDIVSKKILLMPGLREATFPTQLFTGSMRQIAPRCCTASISEKNKRRWRKRRWRRAGRRQPYGSPKEHIVDMVLGCRLGEACSDVNERKMDSLGFKSLLCRHQNKLMTEHNRKQVFEKGAVNEKPKPGTNN